MPLPLSRLRLLAPFWSIFGCVLALLNPCGGDSARAADAVGTITLAWDPNPEPDVVGYRLYYGTRSGEYPRSLDAGNQTTLVISGLSGGTTYYFVATAYNSAGLESLPSTELVVESASVTGSPGSLVPPTVEVQSTASGTPGSGATVLNLRATVDESGAAIARVEFYEGSTKLGEATTSPWTLTWNAVEAGSYSLTAVVFDHEGNSSPSLPVTVTVVERPVPKLTLFPLKTIVGGTTNDSILLFVRGMAGYSPCVIEYSDDLLQWLPLGTPITLTDAIGYRVDDGALRTKRTRFYRLRTELLDCPRMARP